MTGCLYNEIDAYASQWLGRLISAGHIAPGDVDERSIVDLRPSDLEGRSQAHLFAGIGVWSHALRCAGWPDDRPVWTASFPCQPFSAAGRRKGAADERHLWPVGFDLIRACRPPVILGEQVASPDGLGWWDTVSADLEGEGYSCRAFDLCAPGVGAPHIRQRLYWVAYAMHAERGPIRLDREDGRDRPDGGWEEAHGVTGTRGEVRGLADPERERVRARGPGGIGSPPGSMQGVDGERERLRADALTSYDAMGTRPGPTNGFWRDADWLGCRDGKWRPVEARPQSLVDGSAESLGRLRPEIVAQVEEEVNALAVETEGGGAALVRNLRVALGAQARSVWATGRLPGLHEAPFLLAFLRQFEAQDGRLSEGSTLSRSQVARARVRGVRGDDASACAPRQRGLGGQQAGEHPDVVHILPSILARHTQAAWGNAYEAYAEIGFPLGHNSFARVGRLRAYGNAIVAPLAQVFIEEVMACLDMQEPNG